MPAWKYRIFVVSIFSLLALAGEAVAKAWGRGGKPRYEVTVSSDRDLYIEGMTSSFSVTVVRKVGGRELPVVMRGKRLIATFPDSDTEVTLIRKNKKQWSYEALLDSPGEKTLTVGLYIDSAHGVTRIERQINRLERTISHLEAVRDRIHFPWFKRGLNRAIRVLKAVVARLQARLDELREPLASDAKTILVEPSIVISIVAPPDGAYVRRTIDVVVSSNWQHDASVALLLDDVGVQEKAIAGGDFAFVLNTTTVADGSRELKASLAPIGFPPETAALTAPVSMVVDNTSPVIFDISPADGSWTEDLRQMISASYSDATSGIDVASVLLAVDAVDLTAASTVTMTGITYEPAEDLTEAVHHVALSVSDVVGNAAQVTWSFSVDVSGPNIELSCEPNEVLYGETPTLLCTLSDSPSGVDLASIKVFLDGTLRTDDAAPEVTGFTWELPAPLDGGPHLLLVEASDVVGHSTSLHLDILQEDTPAATLAEHWRALGWLRCTPEVAARLVVHSDTIRWDASEGYAIRSVVFADPEGKRVLGEMLLRYLVARMVDGDNSRSSLRARGYVIPDVDYYGDYTNVTIPFGTTLESFCVQLSSEPEVVWADPCAVYQLFVTPDDPEFTQQWGLTQIHAEDGWEYETCNTRPVIIAVLDYGVDYTHPDLAENKWCSDPEFYGSPDHDDDNNGVIDDVFGVYFDGWGSGEGMDDPDGPIRSGGHGTAVAGIAAARTNNGEGIAGVCWRPQLQGMIPEPRIMPIKAALNTTSILNSFDYINKMNMSYNIDVVNCSFGGQITPRGSVVDIYTKMASYTGTIVAAAGNTRLNLDEYEICPAHKADIIVLASDANDVAWGSSNYIGSSLSPYRLRTIAAPGVEIFSTVPGTQYVNCGSGTSLAAPLVSGACALLRWQQAGNAEGRVRASDEWADFSALGGIDVRRLNLRRAMFGLPTGNKIYVESPTSGSVLQAGDACVVIWTWEGNIGNLKIEYSTDDKRTWHFVTGNTPNNGTYTGPEPKHGEFLWNISGIICSEYCNVKVSERDDGFPTGESGRFTIEGTMTVVRPNGGEQWVVDSEQEISWETEGTFTKVDIWYRTSDTDPWQEIVSGTPNDGSYDWTIPDSPSNHCRVRLRPHLRSYPEDASDTYFAIVPKEIRIYLPSWQTNWTVGTWKRIYWWSRGISNFRIEVSHDNQQWVVIGEDPDFPYYQHGLDPNYCWNFFWWRVTGPASNLCSFRVSEMQGATRGYSELFVIVATSAEGVWYVDVDADGNNNGTSWSNAFTYLSDAVDAASAGEEIWVAQGTYALKAPSPESVRVMVLAMKEGVGIYGGFRGTEAERERRDPVRYETILDGSHSQVYPVVRGTADAVLDGFTITNGAWWDSGAAMYNDDACLGLIVKNCVFAENVSDSEGGAIYNYRLADVTVSNCTFSNNSAPSCGGAIYNRECTGVVVENCVFEDNTTTVGCGGAIYNRECTGVVVENCVFEDNTTTVGCGGAIYNRECTDVTIKDSAFQGNVAENDAGGAIYNDDCSPLLSGCVFTGNGASGGGAIYNDYGSSPTISGCTFENNTAYGVGIGSGGGAICSVSSSPSVLDCVFVENRVTEPGSKGGGAIYNYDSSPVVARCEFERNEAPRGGGMCNESLYGLSMANCTFVSNAAAEHGGAMYCLDCTEMTVRDCEFGQAADPGSGNTSDYDGGGLGTCWCSGQVTGCKFSWNTAAHWGGSIYAGGGSLVFAGCQVSWSQSGSDGGAVCTTVGSWEFKDCTFFANSCGRYGGGVCSNGHGTTVFENCVFADNTAMRGGAAAHYPFVTDWGLYDCIFSGNSASIAGGALLCRCPTPLIERCTFSDNSAPSGGGIYIFSQEGCYPTIENCAFTGNSAWSGSGGAVLDDQGGTPKLTNCTFTGNSASSYGGAIGHFTNSSMTVVNCILWQNSAPYGAQLLDWHDKSSVTYCDVEGGYGGDGNIDADPVFANPPDDLHLQRTSPCIDAGDPATALGEDIEGKTRPSGHGYDMGAYEYEYQPVICYVDQSAAGNNDGTSWADAFNRIQDGMESATALSSDEIWVAAATYTRFPASETAVLTMKDGVKVYAGFPSGGGSWTDRHPALNETTLDGEDSALHVVIGASYAVLDGFTVSGGRTDGTDATGDGGGMYNFGVTDLRIHECRFTGNFATRFGAGMCNSGSSSTIEDCVFADNTVEGPGTAYGGGIGNWSNSSVTIVRCLFFANRSGAGGGVGNYGAKCSSTIASCIFVNNSASSHGGAIASSGVGATTTVINCTITQDTATVGGGVAALGDSTIVLTNSIVWGNTATSPYFPSADLYTNETGHLSVGFCDVGEVGGKGSYLDWGGNISQDPRFVNPDEGDFHLYADSPCIDAAYGNYAPETDIEGNARYDDPATPNTGIGTPDYADMGAYEYRP